MPAEKISLDNAKPDKLFYFVANVVVVRKSDMRVLILQRSYQEKVHPGKYGVLGGKLEWGMFDLNNPTRIQNDVKDYTDAAELLLAKESMEEAGIEIEKEIKYINSVFFIRPDGIPVMLVKFAALYKSGEVVIEKAFENHAWVNAEEVKNYDCIEGIDEEIKKSIELFSK